MHDRDFLFARLYMNFMWSYVWSRLGSISSLPTDCAFCLVIKLWKASRGETIECWLTDAEIVWYRYARGRTAAGSREITKVGHTQSFRVLFIEYFMWIVI